MRRLGLGYGLSRGTKSVNYRIPPFKSDALFILNGKIITIGGNKYFKDKTNNGRNFLITGYDFDSTWTIGMPYKSAATISAPAADATLIAADINSFLYTAGTPNQIPVVSLFQDIDYENKLFCRHSAQVLEAVTGKELYEARVLDIVLYNTVKTGADLITCQTYYGVPTENVAAKWVSKTGNDGWAGTKAAPYLTINKACKANQSVYVKSGIYVENSTPDAGCLIIQKSVKLKAIGRSEIRALTTEVGEVVEFHIASSGSELVGFIVNGQTTVNYLIGVYTGTTIDKIDNNYFVDGKLRVVYSVTANVITSFNGNIIKGTIAYYMQEVFVFPITNCLFSGALTTSFSGTGKFRIFTYNKFLITCNTALIDNQVTGDLVFNYNHGIILSSSGTPYLINNNGAAATRTLTAKYNRFTLSGNYTAGVIASTNTSTAVDCQYNNFDLTNVAADIKAIFNLINAISITCKYNVTHSIAETQVYHYSVASTGTICILCDISYNFMKTLSLLGYAVTIGTEGTTANDDKITNISIIGNKELGALYYDNTKVSSEHGIFVGFNLNSIIKYNFIYGSGLGIIIKDAGRNNVSGLIAYNIVVNSYSSGIYSKGVAAVPIYGNIVYNNVDIASIGIYLTINGAGEDADNCIIKNNIVIDKSVNASAILIYIISSAGIVSDHNVLYSALGKYGKEDATAYDTFALWLAHGQDANSINQDTVFNSIASENFWPVTPISLGEDLGATYDDGLDITTNWNGITLPPAIVTKQQAAAWDIGAYIH